MLPPPLTSTRVRARACHESWCLTRTRELGETPVLHRKQWEFATIAQAYLTHQAHGGRVIGFGCGREPLPAWFAAHGADVVATDDPHDNAAWTRTGQHTTDLEALRRPTVCDNAAFDAHVRFRAVDMTAIPDDLVDFDVVWSSGSLEHLGRAAQTDGVIAGTQFLCRAMRCLKPGGLAVHTTEYTPYGAALASPDLVSFTERDFETVRDQLAEQGDLLYPLDLAPGLGLADRLVDHAPYGLPHLLLDVGGHVTTSVVLVIRRGAGVATAPEKGGA